jgi:RNA polymerase sigma factor (sigma-70 family)
MELTDLVYRAKTGDARAQEALYQQSYKRVYYLALRLVKNNDDAEDAAQETFIAAFSALPRLQNDNAFEGWLFQIAVNKCRNKLIRTKQTEKLPDDYTEYIADPDRKLLPEAVIEEVENSRLILEIIDSLPHTQRECVLLYYYSEMSIKQIAEALNCSAGTVKSRLNYARRKIKESIRTVNYNHFGDAGPVKAFL